MVTVAVAVLAALSVTLTTVLPAPTGAVKTPVEALIVPLPLVIEYVYGLVPPDSENETVPEATTLEDAGVIERAVDVLDVVELLTVRLADPKSCGAQPETDNANIK